MSSRDRQVKSYLDELRDAARDLPARRRDGLVAEIELHLSEALPPDAGEAAVRTELERLGDPVDIAAEERGRPAEELARSGAKEYLAIPLLLLGGVFLPILGWIVGVALLWLSRVWSVRQKLVGTLLLPGDLFLGGFLLFAVGFTTSCVSSGTPFVGETPVTEVCTNSESTAERTFAQVTAGLALLIPILTSIYLGIALRRAQR